MDLIIVCAHRFLCKIVLLCACFVTSKSFDKQNCCWSGAHYFQILHFENWIDLQVFYLSFWWWSQKSLFMQCDRCCMKKVNVNLQKPSAINKLLVYQTIVPLQQFQKLCSRDTYSLHNTHQTESSPFFLCH